MQSFQTGTREQPRSIAGLDRLLVLRNQDSKYRIEKGSVISHRVALRDYHPDLGAEDSNLKELINRKWVITGSVSSTLPEVDWWRTPLRRINGIPYPHPRFKENDQRELVPVRWPQEPHEESFSDWLCKQFSAELATAFQDNYGQAIEAPFKETVQDTLNSSITSDDGALPNRNVNPFSSKQIYTGLTIFSGTKQTTGQSGESIDIPVIYFESRSYGMEATEFYNKGRNIEEAKIDGLIITRGYIQPGVGIVIEEISTSNDLLMDLCTGTLPKLTRAEFKAKVQEANAYEAKQQVIFDFVLDKFEVLVGSIQPEVSVPNALKYKGKACDEVKDIASTEDILLFIELNKELFTQNALNAFIDAIKMGKNTYKASAEASEIEFLIYSNLPIMYLDRLHALAPTTVSTNELTANLTARLKRDTVLKYLSLCEIEAFVDSGKGDILAEFLPKYIQLVLSDQARFHLLSLENLKILDKLFPNLDVLSIAKQVIRDKFISSKGGRYLSLVVLKHYNSIASKEIDACVGPEVRVAIKYSEGKKLTDLEIEQLLKYDEVTRANDKAHPLLTNAEHLRLFNDYSYSLFLQLYYKRSENQELIGMPAETPVLFKLSEDANWAQLLFTDELLKGMVDPIEKVKQRGYNLLKALDNLDLEFIKEAYGEPASESSRKSLAHVKHTRIYQWFINATKEDIEYVWARDPKARAMFALDPQIAFDLAKANVNVATFCLENESVRKLTSFGDNVSTLYDGWPAEPTYQVSANETGYKYHQEFRAALVASEQYHFLGRQEIDTLVSRGRFSRRVKGAKLVSAESVPMSDEEARSHNIQCLISKGRFSDLPAEVTDLDVVKSCDAPALVNYFKALSKGKAGMFSSDLRIADVLHLINESINLLFSISDSEISDLKVSFKLAHLLAHDSEVTSSVADFLLFYYKKNPAQEATVRATLVSLACADQSGEVARKLLRTGWISQLRGKHISNKLDPENITAIVNAHSDKPDIVRVISTDRSGRFARGRDYRSKVRLENVESGTVLGRFGADPDQVLVCRPENDTDYDIFMSSYQQYQRYLLTGEGHHSLEDLKNLFHNINFSELEADKVKELFTNASLKRMLVKWGGYKSTQLVDLYNRPDLTTLAQLHLKLESNQKETLAREFSTRNSADFTIVSGSDLDDVMQSVETRRTCMSKVDLSTLENKPAAKVRFTGELVDIAIYLHAKVNNFDIETFEDDNALNTYLLNDAKSEEPACAAAISELANLMSRAILCPALCGYFERSHIRIELLPQLEYLTPSWLVKAISIMGGHDSRKADLQDYLLQAPEFKSALFKDPENTENLHLALDAMIAYDLRQGSSKLVSSLSSDEMSMLLKSAASENEGQLEMFLSRPEIIAYYATGIEDNVGQLQEVLAFCEELSSRDALNTFTEIVSKLRKDLTETPVIRSRKDKGMVAVVELLARRCEESSGAQQVSELSQTLPLVSAQ